MGTKIGIIFLDTTEIIFTVYQQTATNTWTLLQKQTYDLTPLEKGQSLQASEIIEIIANITFSQITQRVTLWKICARGILEPLLLEIERATSMPTELLTLVREQELLGKGVLSELGEVQ